MTDKPQPGKPHVQAPMHHEITKQKRWSFTPSAFVLIIGLALVVGYAAGTRNDQIVATVAPRLGFKVAAGSIDLSSVQDTFRQLKGNFDGNLDEKALNQGASKGLVAAAGDPHTEFFTSKEAEQFKNDLSGNIGGGIGAEIGIRDESPTVVRVLSGTPAEKAGIQANDIVVGVNDQALSKGMTVDQIIQKIRGDIGSTVKLTVARNGEIKDFTMTRAQITSPSVETRVDGDVGIMTIARFDEKTGTDAQKAAVTLKQQGIKKVVLDLRDNGGGYLTSAPDVAGLWLVDKVVVSERQGGKVTDEQRSGDNAVFAGMPTVVLVNAGTASAAEIVTSALKDYKAVTVIGEKTYGKGTVQTMVDLDNGALLKVTIQRWYTPNGNNVDQKGITPDQVVGMTNDDIKASRDPQLEAAKQSLDK